MIIAVPYIGFVLLQFFLYVYGNSDALCKKTSVISAYFVFLIFFGFRGYIFTDVFGYRSWFEHLPDIITVFTTHYQTWWEPGFVYYCSFFKLFTGDYLVFQFCDIAIDCVLLYKALEWFNANTALNYIIFFVMNGLLFFVDTLRNIKSILIFVIALRYIYNRQFLKYLLCCLIALSFHVSSVIFFPLYFVLSRHYPKFIFYLLPCVCLVFLLFGKSMINFFIPLLMQVLPFDTRIKGMIEAYILKSEDDTVGQVFTLGNCEKVLTFVLTAHCFSKIYRGKMILIVNCFLFYFLFYFVFFRMYGMDRVGSLFAFSYWILWPAIARSFRGKDIKMMAAMCLLVYGVLKASLYSQPVQRYENTLFGAMSHSERRTWNNVHKSENRQ